MLIEELFVTFIAKRKVLPCSKYLMYPFPGLASPMLDDSDNFHFEISNVFIIYFPCQAVTVVGDK